MAITRHQVGSATVSTTEFSLVNGSTTSADLTSTGIWSLYLDGTNLDDATIFQVKFKDRFTTGGPQVTFWAPTWGNAQGDAPGWALPSVAAGNGMDITMTLVTGSATVVAWQLWKTS
jgi:hypothetical protein